MSKKRSVINWWYAGFLVLGALVILYIIYVDGGKGI
jgi:uncharacterized protein YpmS